MITTSVIRTPATVASCGVCRSPATCTALDLELGLAGAHICADCLMPLLAAEALLRCAQGYRRPSGAIR